MKRKLSPQEKKELAYKKDHRTHTGECDRAMRGLWAKRKVRVNRKYRRKADQTLRKVISPDKIDTLLAGGDDTTRELIRKGLTREKNPPKWGVGTLREAVESKLKSRVAPKPTNRERKESNARSYMAGIIALERDPNSYDAMQFKKVLDGGSAAFWVFLQDHPGWSHRLEVRLEQIHMEEQRRIEKERIKAEQKRKWGSPTTRRRQETS